MVEVLGCLPRFKEDLPDSGSLPPLTDLLGQMVYECRGPYTLIAQGVRTWEVGGICLQEQLGGVEVDYHLLEAGMTTIGEGQGGDAKYHLRENLKPPAEGREPLVVTVEIHRMVVV